MKTVRIPALLKFFILAGAVYALLRAPGVLAGKPVPQSLLVMYMFFAVAGILLAMTANEDGARSLFAPLGALVRDRSLRGLRDLVFIVLPIAAGLITYSHMKAAADAPAVPRVTHPAPPVAIRAYGRTIELGRLVNPYRHLEEDDPARFKRLVREGGDIYFGNCFFCHGAKLDGRGRYARAMEPRPLPFTGTDTIAQLRESYVFWRVVKGGTGLPAEGAPHLSLMPSWEDKLSEEQVWKVILFIYDYTGNTPR